MRKIKEFFITPSLLLAAGTGEKSGSLSSVYAVAAMLSLLLLMGCILLVRKKRFWFITLFSCVLIVNIGYTLLALSTSLNMALWANRIAYLGSVFLPLAMLMIVLHVTGTTNPKWLAPLLLGVALLIFIIAATPGILPIYYKSVSFSVVNGVARLEKVYGPLHPLYLAYLLGYFSVMVMIIIRARFRKAMGSTSHGVIIAIAVLGNIGVWLIEQLVDLEFEMLSVSYIITELFLLGVHFVANENHKLQETIRRISASQKYNPGDCTAPDIMLETPLDGTPIPSEKIEYFLSGLAQLTPTEKVIYDALVARVTTKEIMANLNIKESTLKYHNRNLYSKLGVSSRKELLELYKQISHTSRTTQL